ncbi:hypothetical protein Tco_0574767, partial [Tanacetum coccineum]
HSAVAAGSLPGAFPYAHKVATTTAAGTNLESITEPNGPTFEDERLM